MRPPAGRKALGKGMAARNGWFNALPPDRFMPPHFLRIAGISSSEKE